MNMYQSAMIILPMAFTVVVIITSILSLAFYFAKEEERRVELIQSLTHPFGPVRIKPHPDSVRLISINQYQRNKKYRELYEQRTSA